jgi:hypothetical protein
MLFAQTIKTENAEHLSLSVIKGIQGIKFSRSKIRANFVGVCYGKN